MPYPNPDPAKLLRRSAFALALLLVPVSLVLFMGSKPAPKPNDDWPMSRHDVRRSGGTPHELPRQLHLHWVRHLPPLTPAWPDQPKMPFDSAYDPIVVGDLIFVASSKTDSVTAYALATGEERWHFVADGPFRFAPAWHNDKLYAVCDDGYLYCLNADDGDLLWKFRGGPSDRKVIGNGRLISTWPARGAPVIADGTVYFAASIWPFMGVFLHALDAESGKVVWTNSGDGSIYIKQPHNADSFAGVAPQGHLAVVGDKLLVPGGRSVPACYDRKTGRLLHYQLAENGKKGGGAEVAATDSMILNGGAAFSLETGKHYGSIGDLGVVEGAFLHATGSGKVLTLDLRKLPATQEGSGLLSKVLTWSPPTRAGAPLPNVLSLVRAGSRLFAGRSGQIVSMPLPLTDGRASITWKAEVEGKPVRLVAARGRLFAVTLEGQLYCFGAGQGHAVTWDVKPPAVQHQADEWTAKAKEIVTATGVDEGYCVAWGVGSGRLIRELLAQTKLHVIAVDPDAKKVRELRAGLLRAGSYGDRACAFVANLREVELPPYMANLMVSENLADAGIQVDEGFLTRMFASLRPYGGVAWLPNNELKFSHHQSAIRHPQFGGMLLTRPGPLPGSADWTHEHADAANTRVSRDRVVKAPLGLLWFGGPSNDAILPRHGHGPQPQVIDGRILIEGMDLLRAVDCYTGRLLWETKLPGLGKIYNNLSHQPGANATGGNFVSMPDGIYVAHGKSCVRIDPATGKKMSEFPFPGGEKDAAWDYVNVVGNYLVGGTDPAVDKKTKSFLSISGDDLSSSRRLVVVDRHSGKLLWSVSAKVGFRHNAICLGGGKLFAIDRLSGEQIKKLDKDDKKVEGKPKVTAFDLATGQPIWTSQADVFGTWLSYSEMHDVLVEAGRNARDTLKDEPTGMRAYDAEDGRELWFEKTYQGPAMIHGDMVLQGQGACDLLTGRPKMRSDPITGKDEPWVWSRNYGCNTPAASEHLLTFRSGAAGYFDLCNDGGTGNFGGFRSSCTNNLIVACGVLSAPEYTRTCVCSYQNQTSLALVPTRDAEMWTFFTAKESKGPVRRVGLNLGAPGDRRADNGTFWLEYPSVGGTSPTVKVTTSPAKPEWFRKHEALVDGELPWVTASGAKGLTSLTVTLDPDAKTERNYMVRLYFIEPDGLEPGERVFSVSLQGREVVRGLDVAGETGGPDRGLVKEFKGVRAGQDLKVSLLPTRGTPAILCGVELVAEGW